MTVRYLTLDDILFLVEDIDVEPVRDVGLLDSARARPEASAFGEDAYPTVPEKAAALLHSLVANHALVDGNKRLGWHACTVFLDLDGARPELSDDEAFELVMEIAAGELTDIAEISARLAVGPRPGRSSG